MSQSRIDQLAVTWRGVSVIRNDMLPERTMVVSPDLYEVLKRVPGPCREPQAHPDRCGCEQVKP